MSAAATGDRFPGCVRDDLAGGLYPRFLNSGSRAGFGRVGCGLAGSAGFPAGSCESDKLNLLSLESPA
jgi:hypothetical protein